MANNSDDRSPEYLYDLHCHTTRSDGNDSPLELIEKAVQLGMKAVAITDHDTLPPKTVFLDGVERDIVEYAHEQGLGLVKGYEFSTDTYVDDVHIVGYYLNWDDPALLKEVARAKNSKSEAYRKLCEILTEKGMPIDYEGEILNYVDGEGNQQTRNPDEVERKFIFEKMAEKGYAKTWGKAKIMVRDDPKLNVRRAKIDPLAAIDLIHQCGGVAVLAHPYLIDLTVTPENLGEMSREDYIERLIENGLDGIEARYTYNKTSYKGSKTVDEIEEEILTKYGERLFISGGSDYHAGHKKAVKNPRQIGEAGLTFEQFSKLFAGKI